MARGNHQLALHKYCAFYQEVSLDREVGRLHYHAPMSRYQNLYARFAKVYDLFYGPFLLKGLGIAMRAMRFESDQHVLEVGIGTGISLDMYPRGLRVIGIDLSSEMLAVAKKKAEKLNIKNVELRIMSAEKLEFEDESFDRVFAPSVLSVVSDPAKVISEMVRVCKTGGLVCIVAHFEGETIIAQAIDKGFDPIAQRYLGFRMKTPRSVYLQQPALELVSIEQTLPPNFSDVIVLRKR